MWKGESAELVMAGWVGATAGATVVLLPGCSMGKKVKVGKNHQRALDQLAGAFSSCGNKKKGQSF